MTNSELMETPAQTPRRANNEGSRNLNRVVLAIVGLGLLAMFAGSFAYRLNHPSLVKRSGVQEQREGQTSASFGEGMQMPTEAMQHIAELMTKLKENPNSYELRIELAEHFIEISNWKGAIPHLEKARELKPDELQPYLYLGFCHFSAGEYETAAEYYVQAVELSGDANAKVNLAYIYKNFLDRGQEADAIFDEVVNDPNAEAELRGIAGQLKGSSEK